MITTGKNRIMIFGPKSDGTYVVEFRTAAGEALAISIPASEAAMIRHFQERMPYGGSLCRTFREEPLARLMSCVSGALCSAAAILWSPAAILWSAILMTAYRTAART